MADICSVDPRPAATLLIPYFEVGTACTPGEANTRFTVTNIDAAPVLSRVQLWSNTGVPVFAFDIYLNGHDQHSVDLHELLCDGSLPSTGAGLPPGEGRLALPPQNFPGCNGGDTPGASPVYPALPPEATELFRAALSGQELPSAAGQCASIGNGRGTADGYITIDAVESCGAPNLSQAGFGDALSARNVLTGSAMLINDASNSSAGLPVLGLEASPALADSASFYGDVGVNVGIRREPLPNAWSVESGSGGGVIDQSDFIVWRAPPAAGSSFTCGTMPPGFPLEIDNKSGYGSRGVFHVSDSGKAKPSMRTMPLLLAAQRVDVLDEFPAANMASGWTYMNLYRQVGGQRIPAQAWVARSRGSAGRFEMLTAGTPLDSSCNGSSFSTISAGPSGWFVEGAQALPMERHFTLSADSSNVFEGGTLNVTVAVGRPVNEDVYVGLLLGGGLAEQTGSFPEGVITTGNSSVDVPLLFDDDGVSEPGFTGSIRIDYVIPSHGMTITEPSTLSIGFTDND